MDIHNRFKELMWYSKAKGLEVGIIGAGGIGSWLTFALCRIGCKPFIYDHDLLELHNLGGQLYPDHEVGSYKVEALKTIAKDFCQTNLDIYTSKFTENNSTAPVMFAAVDNMEARKTIFKRWCDLVDYFKEHHPEKVKECLYMDGRMLAENLQIYTVTSEDIEEYKTTLFEDTEVEEQPCSAKATSHCGMLIGSLMTSIFTNWLSNLSVDFKVVPFCTTLDIPLLNLTEIDKKEFTND